MDQQKFIWHDRYNIGVESIDRAMMDTESCSA